MRRWWRWWRSRNQSRLLRGPRVLAFIGVLLFLDTFTKVNNHTPDWGWHPVEVRWYDWAGILALGIFVLWPPLRLAGALLVSGALGNLTWANWERGTPNPFQAETWDAFDISDLYLLLQWSPETTAFNLADVFIRVGSLLLPVLGFIWWVGFYKSKRTVFV